MSDRLVSVLVTNRVGDATSAISWLRQQEALPCALISLLTSLEYAVGRVWVDECFADAERIVSESEIEDDPA